MKEETKLFCSHCGYHICRCTAIPKMNQEEKSVRFVGERPTTESDIQAAPITHRIEIPAPTETEGAIVIFSLGGTVSMQARNLSKVDLAAIFVKLMKEIQ